MKRKKFFLNPLLDSNLEVKKSAMQAIIDLNIINFKRSGKRQNYRGKKILEIEKLLSQIEIRCSGPEGI